MLSKDSYKKLKTKIRYALRYLKSDEDSVQDTFLNLLERGYDLNLVNSKQIYRSANTVLVRYIKNKERFSLFDSYDPYILGEMRCSKIIQSNEEIKGKGEVRCDYCNKPKEVFLSSARRNKHNYCNQTCRDSHRKCMKALNIKWQDSKNRYSKGKNNE
jgi:hypothetical protein